MSLRSVSSFASASPSVIIESAGQLAVQRLGSARRHVLEQVSDVTEKITQQSVLGRVDGDATCSFANDFRIFHLCNLASDAY